MTSRANKTVKAMATAAAIASMKRAPTFGLRFPSIEIDESATGELGGSVTAGFGAIDSLTGAGVGLAAGSTGVAKTTGGLFGLLSADSSEKELFSDEISCSGASADSTRSESGAGESLADKSTLGVEPRVSDSFLF
tara:strand:- start:5334 stop:5741 length:408 start_codon:yes stop_codon:yes gene_type:complete